MADTNTKLLIVIILCQYLIVIDTAPAAEGGITLRGTDGNDTGSELIEAAADRSKIKCRSCKPPKCEEESVCENAAICYKYTLIDTNGNERLGRGCFSEDEEESSRTQCSTNYTRPSYNVFWVWECCSSGDFCNDGEFPEDDKQPEEITSDDDSSDTVYLVIGIFALICTTILIIGALVIMWRNGGDGFTKSKSPEISLQNVESTFSSGGNRPKLLMQRTLEKCIELKESIGQGRFGNVRKGLWRDEFVAVKIFDGRDEASWKWETEIYRTVLTRHHENILTFYVSEDICSCPAEYWLVTQYHRNGSLFDYLNKQTLTEARLIKLASSFANGLAFLHTDLARSVGSRGSYCSIKLGIQRSSC